MTIYTSPPPARTFREDKATLLVCWWCTVFAAVVIMFRVCGRYIRTERLFKEDWLAFACLIPLFGRMAVVHVILLFGTNNALITDFSDHAIHRRAIGSRLVLVSRILYAATLWMLKLTICEFFKRLTSSIWRDSYERILVCIRWFLLVTFIGVAIADLAECQPFHHYWRVSPDPGARCRQGYVQLLTMGTANVLTDLLLVLFPIPIIIRSKMRTKRKIQLVCLFGGSLLPVGTTLYRIPMIIDRQGSQQYRSLLASIEILFATAVANALILGSFIRDKGVKKHRWKFGSANDSIERTTSRRPTAIRHWGSDEDLVRDLGMSVTPALRGADPTPRPAPIAPSPSTLHSWTFPSETSDSTDLLKPPPSSSLSLSPTDPLPTPRKVSFFDVGGLLDHDPPSPRTPHPSHDPTPPPRRGSAALLHDLGGFLAPPRYRVQGVRSFELGAVAAEGEGVEEVELRDVGGLLG